MVRLLSFSRFIFILCIYSFLSGSGFESVCLGAESIILGRSSVVLCSGTENMSQAPMLIDGLTARWGAALGRYHLATH